MGVTNYYSLEGEIIGERTGAVRTDYSRDALGSVTATRTSAPAKDAYGATYRYKPYGARLAKTGTAPDPDFQWVGTAGYRETSISHSQSYVRARHYGQQEGRWTTIDPAYPSINLYLYVRNKVSTHLDPSGLVPCQSSCCERFEKETLPKTQCGIGGNVGVWSRCSMVPGMLGGKGEMATACNESIKGLTPDQKKQTCELFIARLTELAKGCTHFCSNMKKKPGNPDDDMSSQQPPGGLPWGVTFCCEGKMCGQWCCSIGGQSVLKILHPCISFCFVGHEARHHTLCTQPGSRPKIPDDLDPGMVSECMSWTREATCLRSSSHSLGCKIPQPIIDQIENCSRKAKF